MQSSVVEAVAQVTIWPLCWLHCWHFFCSSGPTAHHTTLARRACTSSAAARGHSGQQAGTTVQPPGSPGVRLKPSAEEEPRLSWPRVVSWPSSGPRALDSSQKGPGSLGVSSYFSLPQRQTVCSTRAGQPDAHGVLQQYYQQATCSFGDTCHPIWSIEDAHIRIPPTTVKTSRGWKVTKGPLQSRAKLPIAGGGGGWGGAPRRPQPRLTAHTGPMDMSLGKLRELVMDREA